MPAARAGDLEVHVAVVVFLAGDVGQDGERVAFLHEAHRDARDRALDGHAGVHERDRAAADRRHRRRAVRLEDVGHDADRVREFLLVRQDRLQRAPREAAVADLAAAGGAEPLDLADGERREVVVEEERALGLALEVLDELRVVGRAERHGDERLRLAAREERRAVRAREDAGLDRDRADLVEGAAVEALPLLDDRLARERLDELGQGALRELARLRLVLGDQLDAVLLDFLDLRVRLDLPDVGEGLHHRALPLLADGGGEVRGDRRGRLERRLDDVAARGHRGDRLDDLPDLLVALQDGLEHHGLGDFLRARLDHRDGVVRADDDEVELGLLALLRGRVEDEAVADLPDADGAEHVLEGDRVDRERGGGAVDREDVGVVLAVGREDEAHDLGLVVEALGEERAERPVDHPAGEDFLLGGAPLALEEAAGDPARRVRVFLVLDGEGKEVDVLRFLRVAGGHEDHGVAALHDGGAVGLLGDLAGLDRERTAIEIDGQGVMHGTIPFDVARPGAHDEPGRGMRAGACRRNVREEGLLAQSEAFDQGAVPLRVASLHVIEQAPPPADHLEEPPPGVMVLGVGLEVLGQLGDALGEKGDLDLGGSGVASRGAGSW